MPRQLPPEFRQRALTMLEESLPEHETERTAIRRRQLGLRLGGAPQMASRVGTSPYEEIDCRPSTPKSLE